MWSSLPSNLRTVLGTALVLGVGVAGAAFTLSFFALREAAEDPALKFGQGHAWLFPIGVDMALIFFEVLLLAASMVRVQERGRVVPYPRAVPFMLVMVAAASTLYFNATRVPEDVRPIALAVPVASILVTLGLAYLLKMLAAASGVEAIHLAPPALEPNRIVRKGDVIEGQLTRLHEGTPANGQIPPNFHENGQIERQDWEHIGGNGTTKKRVVEEYLSGIAPEQLKALTARQIAADLTQSGFPVTERTVIPVLKRVRERHQQGSGQ